MVARPDEARVNPSDLVITVWINVAVAVEVAAAVVVVAAAEAVPTIMTAEAVATIMEVAEEEDGLDHQALEAMEAIITVVTGLTWTGSIVKQLA